MALAAPGHGGQGLSPDKPGGVPGGLALTVTKSARSITRRLLPQAKMPGTLVWRKGRRSPPHWSPGP